MSEILKALDNKVKIKGPNKGSALQEAIDSLPFLSEDSLSEAEIKKACEVLIPHIGDSSVLDLIRSKLKSMAKVTRTIKSVFTGDPKPKAKTKTKAKRKSSKSSKKKKD